MARGRIVVRGGPLGVDFDEQKPDPTTPDTTATVEPNDLETNAEDFAARMLAELPQRAYKTGSTGVEMHLRRVLPVDGFLTSVAIHYRIVIKPANVRKK